MNYKDSWNEIAAGWQKHEAFLGHWLKNVNYELINQLEVRPKSVILDAATGLGLIGISICEKVTTTEVIGLDISEAMLVTANNRAKKLNIENFKALLCDVSSMPFESGYFDAVACGFGLMNFEDPSKSLDEMIRVLKPGCKISLSSWAANQNNWLFRFESRSKEIMLEGKNWHKSKNCQQSTIQLFSAKGIIDVTQNNLSGEILFESLEQYVSFIADLSFVYCQLKRSSSQESSMILDEISRYGQEYIRNDKIVFQWSVVLTSGRKSV